MPDRPTQTKILTDLRKLGSAVVIASLLAGCAVRNTVDPRLANEMPPRFIWAWERPEDLLFLDPNKFGVAFLAQTIFLENDTVITKPRRQPLEVPPGTYMIAVTRIETAKDGEKRAALDEEMVSKTATLILSTIDLPDVRGVQIDFDAVVSEREFYGSLVKEVKRRLAPELSLTMTSLASWCTGDAWFNDFPVDEAVPMVFQMGADTDKIKRFLRNGNDWNEPLCRGSYGVSLDEPLNVVPRQGRRIYYFKNSSWRGSDIERLN